MSPTDALDLQTAPREPSTAHSPTPPVVQPRPWAGQTRLQKLGTFFRDVWAAARDVLSGTLLHAAGPEVEGFHCALCGGRYARQVFTGRIPDSRRRTVAQCEECGLVSTHPMPAEEEIPGFYGDVYYGEENAKFGPVTELFVFLFRLARLRAVRRMTPKGGRVLDVGCARGLFLWLLKKRGHETWGTELSEDSARTAKLRIGADRVRVGPLESCGLPEGHFDAITAWQVFEHLREPEATLRECRRILKPGGALLLSVPNIDSWQARWSREGWFHLDVPRHLHHYGESTLRRMLEKHGFRVEGVSHYSLEQNPFGLMQSFLHRMGLPHMGLYNLLRGPKHLARCGRLSRLARYAAYLGAFPFAALLSYVFSLLGSGATFTILARLDHSRAPAAPTGRSPAIPGTASRRTSRLSETAAGL